MEFKTTSVEEQFTPRMCLATAPAEDGQVHACQLPANHAYVPEAHHSSFWHHCPCDHGFRDEPTS